MSRSLPDARVDAVEAPCLWPERVRSTLDVLEVSSGRPRSELVEACRVALVEAAQEVHGPVGDVRVTQIDDRFTVELAYLVADGTSPDPARIPLEDARRHDPDAREDVVIWLECDATALGGPAWRALTELLARTPRTVPPAASDPADWETEPADVDPGPVRAAAVVENPRTSWFAAATVSLALGMGGAIFAAAFWASFS